MMNNDAYVWNANPARLASWLDHVAGSRPRVQASESAQTGVDGELLSKSAGLRLKPPCIFLEHGKLRTLKASGQLAHAS